MKRIFIDYQKCLGCKNCVLACMVEKTEGVSNLWELNLSHPETESRNYVSSKDRNTTVPMICRHCEEPECVHNCISGAMRKDNDSGLVNHDSHRCVGCCICVFSCPYGVLRPSEKDQQKVLKCDLCDDKDTPVCVSGCVTGALSLEEVEIS